MGEQTLRRRGKWTLRDTTPGDLHPRDDICTPTSSLSYASPNSLYGCSYMRHGVDFVMSDERATLHLVASCVV